MSPNLEDHGIALPGRNPSLSEIYVDLLALGANARIAEDLGDPHRLRERIQDEIRRVETEARKAGYSDVLEPARFAIVAYLNEMVGQNRKWPHRAAWFDQPVPHESYNMAHAGKIFYERLKELRQRSDTRSLLELYSHCLAMGFRGQLADPAERETFITTLAREVAQGRTWSSEELSPHWVRSQDSPVRIPKTLPAWLPFLVAGAVAVLLLLAFWRLGLGRAEKMAVPARTSTLRIVDAPTRQVG